MDSNGDQGDPVVDCQDGPPRSDMDRHLAYFAHAPLAVMVVDASGRYVEVNPAACRLTGYEESELLGLSVSDLLAEESLEAGLRHFARVKEAGCANGEFALMRKDGTRRWITCDAVRLSEDRFISFKLDTTDRRDAEDSLAAAHRLLATVLEAVPDLLIVVDRDFGIRYTNAKGHDQVAQTDPEKRKTCYGRFKLLDHPCEDCSARPVFETGCIVEREMLNPADRRFREVRAFPILDASQHVEAVVEHVRDVTDRKRTENILVVERDLALQLLSLDEPREIARACLEAAIAVSGLECGGIHLADPASRGLCLANYRGVSQEAVASVAAYSLDAEQRQVLRNGEPLVVTRSEMEQAGLLSAVREGLVSIVFVPVQREGRVVACLTLASRTTDSISPHVIVGLESVAAQMEAAIARVRSEELRRQSEERYRLLVEAAPCSILVVQDGRYVYANPYAERLLAYPAHELADVPIDKTIHPESRDTIFGRVQRVEHGEPTPPVRIKVLRKDGVPVDTETASVPIMFDGRPAALVVGQDMTARQRAEEIMQESEDRLRLATKATNDVIWDWDLVQDRQRWNEAGATVFGWTDIVESPQTAAWWLQRVHPEDRERVGESFHAVYTSRDRCHWQDEYRFLRADGGYAFVLDRGYVMRDAQGKAVRMIGAMLDLTARKQAEESLRRSEEHYRVLAETMLQGVVHQDRDGTIIAMNPAAERILGKGPDEFLGSSSVGEEAWTIREDGSPFPGLEHPAMVACRTGQQVKDVIMGVFNPRVDAYRWINIDAVPLFRPGEDQPYQVYTVFEDITERKQAEQQKREMERRLLDTQKLESLGILAGGIAHDFNNLLAGIMGYADLLKLRLPQCEAAREDVDIIKRIVQRAAGLTRQLLAYAGKGKFAVEPVDLSRIVADTRTMLEVSVSKKAVVTYHLASDLPAIEADPAQIHQVVFNLVINASEALGDKSGAIAVRTREVQLSEAEWTAVGTGSAGGPGHYVCLEVSDTGCGMDQETLTMIFDPFFTTKFTGRGLGLAALHGIVRGHHGGLLVTSEPGQGTTFQVFFPVCRAAGPRMSVEAVAPSWEASGTVLVADDEEIIRGAVRRMIEHAGFDVVTAADGEQALRVYVQHQSEIVCVILDLTMPKKNGEETLRDLRKINPTIRVILTSGFSEDNATERFSDLGLAGFIQKPYQLDAVVQTLRRALARDAEW